MAKGTLDATTARFFEHVAIHKDATLLILKAHLFFEEVLNNIIDNNVVAPAALTPAGLTFFQKLCIGRALLGEEMQDALIAIEKLNRTRNKLAHHLSPIDLEASILEFCDDVLQIVPDEARGLFTAEETSIKRLQGSVALLAGIFISYLRRLPGVQIPEL